MIYTLAKHQKLKPFANFIIILFYSNNVHETENIKDHPSIINVQFGFQLRKEKNIDKAHSYTQTKKNNIKYRQLENNI